MLLDGEQVCACLVPLGQVEGREVVTVEGLGADGHLSALQDAFHRHGAAQCGICTPGMLMAAASLLRRNPEAEPRARSRTRSAACSAAAPAIARSSTPCSMRRRPWRAPAPAAGAAVGARIAKLDGIAKLTGAERFGADACPADACGCASSARPMPARASPSAISSALRRRHSGLALVLTAADVPSNGYRHLSRHQGPAGAGRRRVRYRGEAVLALVGDARRRSSGIADDELPIDWQVRDAGLSSPRRR